MPIINSIAALKDEMTGWRRDIHAHPETAFEEVRTSALVAEKLESWGVEVHRGLGKTGVVGVLRGRGDGGRTIGLRADMDALPMNEENDVPWKSTVPGKFHGCGHDGHTSMLLGAAKYLSETRNFDGIVHFIFQPAEEGAGGGRAMVEEGLFDKFHCDEVYALHNWPELPAGTVGLRPGPIMAAADKFDVTIRARGGHAAMPHKANDPVVIAAQIIQAYQTLVSRQTDPLKSAVITVAQIHAGSTYNVIAEEASLSGTLRSFDPEVRAYLTAGMERLAKGIAKAFEAEAEFVFHEGYPATVNHDAQAEKVASVAREVVGADKVSMDAEPSMGAEDFSFMLNKRPGAYLFLGQAGGPSACNVHNPRYDFNDEILPIGASLLASLVESGLKRA
ncbi:M20 aminoacylase family protein [Inquilinus sp. CAU 1745]|uniref:M20 aminoacylase family protein n=1 Tax=Inquilinus sp. CAU 1745 TaxID=3140369 RepID=UPI00325BFC62